MAGTGGVSASMDARVDRSGGEPAQGAPALARMPVLEFVDRIVDGARDHGREAAWLLGAGCSVTSGIPSASALVRDWLDKLERRRKRTGESRDAWLEREFGPDLDWREPAAHYGLVFHRCHPSPDDRQTEIERICMLGHPGIGYATLAQVLSHPVVGDKLNTVLTTNFDDLLAEALYYFGPREARPKVISHEALSRFLGARSRQPTIVKIHGDALLSPRNTSEETRRLAAEFDDHLSKALQRKALIFVGYGGRDESIQHFFNTAIEDGLDTTVYWVGAALPAVPMLAWLASRNAQWVEHGDFDELMCLFRKKLDLPVPDEAIMHGRWEKLRASWTAFEARFAVAPDSDTKAALEPFLEDFRKSLPPAWHEAIEVLELGRSDADTADKKFIDAFAISPDDLTIRSDDAVFLQSACKDFDGADDHFRHALAVDPLNSAILDAYASLLWHGRGDHTRALALLDRALAIAPNDAHKLGNSAQILLATGKHEEGLKRLYTALPLALNETSPKQQLITELLFYLVAHDRQKADGALANLKGLIKRGVRTPNWSFDGNIARAQDDGHPEVALLRDLAKVLSYGADPALLDNHVAWCMA